MSLVYCLDKYFASCAGPLAPSLLLTPPLHPALPTGVAVVRRQLRPVVLLLTFLFVAASIAGFHFVHLIIIAPFAPVSVVSQGRSPTPAFRRGIDRGGAAERSTSGGARWFT